MQGLPSAEPTTAAMTVEDVMESTRENVRSIIGQMTRYSANVSGSDGYWLSQQEKLESAAEQLPNLTVFTTYSAADHHWFDLHRLMPSFSRGFSARHPRAQQSFNRKPPPRRMVFLGAFAPVEERFPRAEDGRPTVVLGPC